MTDWTKLPTCEQLPEDLRVALARASEPASFDPGSLDIVAKDKNGIWAFCPDRAPYFLPCSANPFTHMQDLARFAKHGFNLGRRVGAGEKAAEIRRALELDLILSSLSRPPQT